VPALDGLRGLALVGVLLFHANGALPGGFLGVDLFFVLSGFLITSLLLAEHEQTGRIALSAFWVRRARRLFPALLALMPAIALYGAYFARPGELRSLRGEALATLGYVANWRTILSHKSYWQLFASPSPLEHTWSLAIEEQFYVVWPLLVAALLGLRIPPRRAVLALSLTVAVASIVATLVLFEPGATSRVYLGTDTRAVGIALGAALATLVSPATTLDVSWRRALDVAGVIAALLLGLAWWKLTGESRFLYHGGLWLTELAALVLIVCATQEQSWVGRALAFRPLRLLGAVSYGVYLWHWPVNVFLTPDRVHARGLLLHVVHFAVTFVIAGASYRFLERPILTRGLPFGRPIYVVPAAVALAVLLVVRGTYARKEPSTAMPAVAFQSFAPPSPEAPEHRVMLVGDSTSSSLGWALRGVRAPGLVVELRGRDGCTMLADTCGGDSWAAETEEVRPDATLLMLGGAFMHGIGVDGEWRKACFAEWDRRFETTIEQRLVDLKSARGQVWAVTIPYGLEAWDTAALHAEVDCINRSIRKAASSVPGVQTLELSEYLCPKGECQIASDAGTIRPDGVHFAIDGGGAMARWVLERIHERAVAEEAAAAH